MARMKDVTRSLNSVKNTPDGPNDDENKTVQFNKLSKITDHIRQNLFNETTNKKETPKKSKPNKNTIFSEPNLKDIQPKLNDVQPEVTQKPIIKLVTPKRNKNSNEPVQSKIQYRTIQPIAKKVKPSIISDPVIPTESTIV